MLVLGMIEWEITGILSGIDYSDFNLMFSQISLNKVLLIFLIYMSKYVKAYKNI